MPGRPAVVGAVGRVMRSLMSSAQVWMGHVQSLNWDDRWQGREWRGVIHGTAQKRMRQRGRGRELRASTWVTGC